MQHVTNLLTTRPFFCEMCFGGKRNLLLLHLKALANSPHEQSLGGHALVTRMLSIVRIAHLDGLLDTTKTLGARRTQTKRHSYISQVNNM